MDPKTISALIRLFLLVIAGFIIAQLFSLALAFSFGYDLETIRSMGTDFAKKVNVYFLKYSLLISHVFMFIIPSVLFAYLSAKRQMWGFLGIKKYLNLKNLGLAFIFLIVSYPAVSYSYTINSWIPLADWMHSNEELTALTLQKVLYMENLGTLFFNLFLVALIPAIGEEFLFRGLIQKIIEKGSNKHHLAVWIASIAFSFFHLQFEGFLPRLFLGLILGYSFLWTKNLLIPMILHFANNALPILSLYFYKNDLASLDPSKAEPIAWYIGLSSFILGSIVGYFFMKNSTAYERA